MSYSQGQDKNFGPLIVQSRQGKALPPDAMPDTPSGGLNPYLIPDGFSYYVNLKYLPYRALPMQIRLLDKYRRESLQGLWQPRWYSAPPDATVPIVAGDTLQIRLRVANGSILYGYSFAVYGGGTVADLRIWLVDEISNNSLDLTYVTGTAYRANFLAGSPSAGFNFVMPPEPSAVTPGGNLLVNIVNTATANRNCQLLLMFLEPAGSPQ